MIINARKPRSFPEKYKAIILAVLLAAATFGIYYQIIRHGFINFDDDLYVTTNVVVQKGISPEGLQYAFTLTDNKRSYWHPLTWLSHMLDCQLFGLNAGMHHLTSLLLHISSSLLLFFVFYLMTGAYLPGAIIASLFAIHPLSVDSVAWIAERKNVLSTFFWMLTMLAYIAYTRKPDTGKYLIVCVIFTMGLLSKPFLVTLPFVLLMIDFWPLNRARMFTTMAGSNSFPRTTIRKLVLEKVPLLALSVAVILISSHTLKLIGGYITRDHRPMSLRIENAVVAYTKYVGKIIWPDKLAVYYPFPASIPLWQVIGASLVLIIASLLVISVLKSRPWFALGWFWFLGTLFPMIGLVQGGLYPEMADRWVYVPQIGIFIMIAWPVASMINSNTILGKLSTTLSLFLLIVLGVVTWHQTGHWQDSYTLFTRAMEVTGPNAIVHRNLGQHQVMEKDYTGAVEHFQKSIELNPNRGEVHNNLGLALLAQKETQAALHHYRKAIQLRPRAPSAYVQAGKILMDKGNLPEAIQLFRQALAIEPKGVLALHNLGYCLAESGDFKSGEKEVLKAMALAPDKGEGFYNAGAFYGKFKMEDKAQHYLEKALAHHPKHTDANYNLGIIAAGRNNNRSAENYFLTALAATPDHVPARNNLGLLYSKTGRFKAAVAQFEKALEIAPDDTLVRFNLADALLQAGQVVAASEQFGLIIEIDADHSGAVAGQQQANQYLALVDAEIARTADLLRFDPESPVLLVTMGDLHLNRGDHDHGIEYYRRALAIYPDQPGILTKIAAAFSRTGNYLAAISYFEKIINLAPEKPEGYYNVACMYSRLNEIEKADQWLKLSLGKGYDKWRNIETDADLHNYRKSAAYDQLLKTR